MIKFNCQKCKSSKLSYQKYVSSEAPLTFNPNDFISYEQPQINEEDEAVGLSGYICGTCGHPLYHCGFRIETEKELIDLLTMDPDKRQEQEKLYQDSEEETARQEEQREQDEIATYQIDE